jgi:hypothetical protein
VRYCLHNLNNNIYLSFLHSGIYVLLAFNCIERLVNAHGRWTLSRKVLLTYTVLLFVVETIYFVAGCKWSAIEFVDAPVDPAIFAGQLSSRMALLKNSMYTVAIWIADSFIVSVSLDHNRSLTHGQHSFTGHSLSGAETT